MGFMWKFMHVGPCNNLCRISHAYSPLVLHQNYSITTTALGLVFLII